jgi:alanine-glyoxylate transaminase / serine-glyoxylate transaminase / serine-pyruvate transaminase
VEPGEQVVVGVAGYFGGRMAEMVRRAGGVPLVVEAPWGTAVPAEAIAAALRDARPPVKAVALVHAETSTGMLQPLEEILSLARAHGALTVVDAVTSLGGIPLEVDALGIDVCYSGTQKCVGSPPGFAPITVSPRAVAAMEARRTPPVTFYMDLLLLRGYWRDRAYHHTAPIQGMYALREALRLLLEEGLPARWERHRKVHDQLARGVKGLGLEFLVEEDRRLPVLNALRIPDGVDDRAVRQRLLQEHGIEIGGGLGPLAARVWRVGLMGYSAREENVARLLTALRIILGAPRMSKPPRRS